MASGFVSEHFPRPFWKGRGLAASLALGVIAACSGSGAAGDLSVTEARTYASPIGKDAIVCLTLHNTGVEEDNLVSVATDVSAKVDVRGRGGKTGNGATMVNGVTVPAGAATKLDHAGTHIWLRDLVKDLNPGTKFPLVLTFEKTGRVEAQVMVDPICQEPVMEAFD